MHKHIGSMYGPHGDVRFDTRIACARRVHAQDFVDVLDDLVAYGRSIEDVRWHDDAIAPSKVWDVEEALRGTGLTMACFCHEGTNQRVFDDHDDSSTRFVPPV